jgi:hypothetical protein
MTTVLSSKTIGEALGEYEAKFAFARHLVPPQEEWLRYTAVKWDGSYRWFRSANVICLEKVRRLKELGRIGPCRASR